MRYALRNQEKIAKVYSEEYLKQHIIASLDNYFSENCNTRILHDCAQEAYVSADGTNYQILRINDIADKDCMLEFYVLIKIYDVLRLAFVGRIKG